MVLHEWLPSGALSLGQLLLVVIHFLRLLPARSVIKTLVLNMSFISRPKYPAVSLTKHGFYRSRVPSSRLFALVP